jgi:4'-phosphopantetheinyl transferase
MPIDFRKPIINLLDTTIFTDEQQYQKAYLSVSEERRRKIDACRFSKDKRLSLGVGILLEEGAKHYGLIEYSLQYGPHKKPYFKEQQHLFFSLSHSGSLAVSAFYDKEVGVDVEEISEISEKLMRKTTTAFEFSYLMSLEEKEQKEQFFRLWTAKESYMKYTGCGLSLSLTDIEINFEKTLSIKRCGDILPVTFDEYEIDGYKLTVCY